MKAKNYTVWIPVFFQYALSRLVSKEKHHVYRCCCARDEGSFGVHCVAGGGLVCVFAKPFHCPELQER